ncbi:MAG: hypothetical protein DSY55_05670 [Clostridia bacterium]|nr:MAG: hypothetical protein DSY55_05670 [Clostridia bacterium]
MRKLRSFRSLSIWLIPGLHIKRWLGVLLVGITLISLGLAYLLRAAYAAGPYPAFVYWLTLQFLPRAIRAVLFGGAGIGLTVWAFLRLNQSLLEPFTEPDADVAKQLYRHRQRRRGPHIVCIGGGTGMPSVLRGVKAYTDHITAIVTVADDGGSSGRLRREMGLLPPGDFRNNLAALSEAESVTRRLFQYRFPEGTGLAGHAFGNLYLAAMAGVTGSFEQGLLMSNRVLKVRGRILPSTLELIKLVADVVGEDGRIERIVGESLIPRLGGGRRIRRVYLDPDDPPAYPESIKAILNADMIVAGPGSLYTSVIPNLLVPGIAEALRASRALKVYVCNIATQPGETDGYDVADHVRALAEHAGRNMFQYVLANDMIPAAPPPGGASTWVGLPETEASGYRLVTGALQNSEQPWRHDPQRMARALMSLYARHSA